MASADTLIEAYERFLEETDAPREELIARFKQREHAARYSAQAREYGDRMFELLEAVAKGSLFYRFMVV